MNIAQTEALAKSLNEQMAAINQLRGMVATYLPEDQFYFVDAFHVVEQHQQAQLILTKNVLEGSL